MLSRWTWILIAVVAGCAPPPELQSVAKKAKSETETTAAAPAMERVVADVGVGAQGRSLDNETGIGGAIASPAKAYFATRERAVFTIQIPHAMSLFNATEGRFPSSHEEFMEKIVQANSIQLPRLTEGARYVYDSQTHELMVERPR